MTTVMRYRRRADVLWRRSLDSVVVLPSGIADPITISTTGPEVWELLDEWRTLDALSGILSLRHNTDAARVRQDVAPLLDLLERAGALEAKAADGDPQPE